MNFDVKLCCINGYCICFNDDINVYLIVYCCGFPTLSLVLVLYGCYLFIASACAMLFVWVLGRRRVLRCHIIPTVVEGCSRFVGFRA